MWIETIRDVEPGEELAYDYAYVLDERHTPAAKISLSLRIGEVQRDDTREKEVSPHRWRSDDALDCRPDCCDISCRGWLH